MAHQSLRKRHSFRHTRAIQRDRTRRPTVAPPAPAIAARLTDLIHPATFAQLGALHAAGGRQRLLTLPLMAAFVLSMVWRQIGSVREAVRVLNQEGFLWTAPTVVSRQAVNQRLRTLPAALFKAVLDEVLPQLTARAAARVQRRVPVLAWAHRHFTAVVAADGATLDGLLHQVGLLRGVPGSILAGRMAALLDVTSRLPRQIWFDPDPTMHDQGFWERIRAGLAAGMLLLIDLGFWNYQVFDGLAAEQIWFLSQVKENCSYRVVRVLARGAQVREYLVRLGKEARPGEARYRLVELRVGKRWVRYLTNVLDPADLPVEYMPLLYQERWRIEDAFLLVKRLLGLAYFWGGASTTVQWQVWATWVLYGVLQDLTDEVAAGVARPVGAVSVEMVYRALYHYTQAYQRDPTLEVVPYLVGKAKELDLLKARWQAPPRLPPLGDNPPESPSADP